ncbi:MAG: dihydrofolate reductase [Thermoanaerobaculia bacterium]|nr:dihydrofolate reductase [Thermoanaerobaculia bacterium]
MSVVLIAALGRRREIGNDGVMPWHLPADLKHFQRTTRGHVLVMGRRTFEATGLLPGRPTVVVTGRPGFVAPGATVAPTVAAAIELGRGLPGGDEIYLCGGSAVYREGLELGDEMNLTWIDGEFPADTFFPEFDPAVWREVASEEHPADAANAYALRFARYRRVR